MGILYLCAKNSASRILVLVKLAMIINMDCDVTNLNILVMGSKHAGKSYFISNLLHDCLQAERINIECSKNKRVLRRLVLNQARHTRTIEDSTSFRYIPSKYAIHLKRQPFLHRIVRRIFNKKELHVAQYQKDTVPVNLSISEIGGDEEFRSLWNSSINSSDAFILVYNVLDLSSLKIVWEACRYISELKKRSIADIPILIVENETPETCDLHPCSGAYGNTLAAFSDGCRYGIDHLNDARDISKIYGIQFFSMDPAQRFYLSECIEAILCKVQLLINKVGTIFSPSGRFENCGRPVRLAAASDSPELRSRSKIPAVSTFRSEASSHEVLISDEKVQSSDPHDIHTATEATIAPKLDLAENQTPRDGPADHIYEKRGGSTRRPRKRLHVTKYEIASDTNLYKKTCYPLNTPNTPPLYNSARVLKNPNKNIRVRITNSQPELNTYTCGNNPHSLTRSVHYSSAKFVTAASSLNLLSVSPLDAHSISSLNNQKTICSSPINEDTTCCSVFRRDQLMLRMNSSYRKFNPAQKSPSIIRCASTITSNNTHTVITISSEEQILNSGSDSLMSSLGVSDTMNTCSSPAKTSPTSGTTVLSPLRSHQSPNVKTNSKKLSSRKISKSNREITTSACDRPYKKVHSNPCLPAVI